MAYNHDPQIQRWFNSQRWQRLRAYVIGQHPFCQHCLGQGIYTPTEEVHHLTPVQSVPAHLREATMFNADNLLCVCRTCHKQLDAKGKTAHRRREYQQIRTDSACSELFGMDADTTKGNNVLCADNQSITMQKLVAKHLKVSKRGAGRF